MNTTIRLAIGLLVGGATVSGVSAHAQGPQNLPAVRRLNLDFKGTPFRKALEQVFVPGSLRVKLEADVPPLPVTLALKNVDEDTAFRLLIRQAKKQEQDLQFEPIDDGYRVFLGKAILADETNPYPLAPQPKLPKPFAPPTPDFPVVQNREVEPFVAELLQRAESGESLLPMPRDPDEGNEFGGEFGVSPLSANPYGDYDSGLDGFGGGRGSFGGGSGYFGGGLRNFGDSYSIFGGSLTPRVVDPYRSPLAGGLAVSDQISQRLYERKKKPLPSFYDHTPQWIHEPRTIYWPPPRSRRHGGGGGSKRPADGDNGPIGGGYLPR